MSTLCFLSAVVRFITLWFALPVRGLSGYFVGQITSLVFYMALTVVILRKHIGRSVKMASYFTEDWRPILLFTAWSALLYSMGHIVGTTESFVIRHRLSELDSAGYYMISRFAEIAYIISTASTIALFPLLAEQHENGTRQEYRLLIQSTSVSIIVGICFSLIITPVVSFLFQMESDWSVYMKFVPYLLPLCVVHLIRGTTHSFVMYKLAKNEFSFISVLALFYGAETVLLYGLTGYGFFLPWLPEAWGGLLSAFNPCRLSVVLSIILAHAITMGVYVTVSIIKIRTRFHSDTKSIKVNPSAV
jgi:O-antigen/teichoic acid export membrane protein